MIGRISPSRSKRAKAVSTETPLLRLEDAFLVMKKPDEITRFLLDLCTPAEIAAFRERWEIAQLVEQDMPYREVAERTGASTATVTRVARYLRHERHCGYRRVLDGIRERNQ